MDFGRNTNHKLSAVIFISNWLRYFFTIFFHIFSYVFDNFTNSFKSSFRGFGKPTQTWKFCTQPDVLLVSF